MKLKELPFRFRMMYQNWYWQTCLIALGEVKYKGNPYFGIEERHVENQIVRYLGKRPDNPYRTFIVERDDGTNWQVQLCNFKDYEFIDKVERV